MARVVMISLICLVAALGAAISAIAADMPAEKEYVNSVGMKLLRIEPGVFQMGVGKTPLPMKITHHRGTQPEGDFDEKPNHKVEISRPFYMGVCEVTNYQYELFDPSHKRLRGKDAGLSSEDDEAVINVNWYEAQAYCRWLSDIDGREYRLPTEAEWEYACRAGTTKPYYFGDELGKEFLKNAGMVGVAKDVPLHVGKTTPNAWGLYDMHGNVEEWCSDWYGPYQGGYQLDPVGYVSGDFRVTRSGSHGTDQYYLRSANRLGTVPENKHWLIGFRVVLGETPTGKALPMPEVPLNQRNVIQRNPVEVKKGPDPETPYFKGPRKYVRMPAASNGPVFAGHNHCPAIVECPNGDLLSIWYTGIGERERNMAVCGSRLVWGAEQWQQASPFWDPPDRNDTALSAWYDDDKTLYHFNSMSVSSNWARMSVVMRTSTDNGATWSTPRLILPEHNGEHQVSEPVFRLQDGSIAITNDGARTLWVSSDKGLTWTNPGGNIRGNHPGGLLLDDGRIFGLGRGSDIDGRMPQSISSDNGKTFEHTASEFQSIGGGQRLVLLKLREGPLFFASFGNSYGRSQVPVIITDSEGNQHKATELFGAVSLDEGKTWPYKRIITNDGPGQTIESTDGGAVTLSGRSSEHRAYLSVCQGTDGVINLISSRQHYAFNLKWMMTPPPPPAPHRKVKHEVETFDGKEFDLKDWVDYKSYTGGFNGKGQYVVNSIMPYGGISRVAGKGSFEATFAIKNMRFHEGYRWREMAFGFKDKLARTVFATFSRDGLNLLYKDTLAKHEGGIYGGRIVGYTEVPKSFKMKFVWNEPQRRIRIFYGLNGDEPVTEAPKSIEGMYMTEPYSESTAAYFLMSEATAELDHYEIKPIEP